jgi:dihydrofolate reductase
MSFRNAAVYLVEMADLVYMALASLDGYIEDERGTFDWAEPDEEVHTFVNDLERGVGTYLYGRRLYETMAIWETLPLDDQPDHIREFAELWRAADKIVYSRTLDTASTSRTRIERDFDADAVRRLKDGAERDLVVGGAHLAGHAFRAGLVDQLHLVLAPVVVGAGKRALPDDVRFPLELVGERRFGGGFVHLHYRT